MEKSQIKKIIKALEDQMSSASGKSFDKMERARRDLKNWDGADPLPHEKMLREMNVLEDNPVPEKESVPVKETIQVEETIKDINHLLAEGHLYEAIQVLERESTEDADKRLRRLRIELENKTNQLVNKARQTEKQHYKDFATQKDAWRAVQEANPDNQEAREALCAVEQAEVRYFAVRKGKDALKLGEEGNRLDNLPMLNDALTKIKTILDQVKNEPSLQDLQDEISRAKDSIEKLRRDTRNRLGTMATAESQKLYREAYIEARELFAHPSPPPTIVKEDGKEEDLHSFWAHIRNEFVNWLRGKADDCVVEALHVAQISPKLARDKLTDALNILHDDALVRDDYLLLEFNRNNIANEIRKIEQQIVLYEKAQYLVMEGQNRNLPPSERRKYLLQARELFPPYPRLSIYIENVEIDYAGQLAREGNEAVVEANYLAAQDKSEIFENQEGKLVTAVNAVQDSHISIQRNLKTDKNLRTLVVLDIDESLVHSSDDPLDPNAHFEIAGYQVIKRPYLDEFLEKITQWYDVAIWTGATELYANSMIPEIIPNPSQLKFIWSRERCIRKWDYDKKNYYWLKDIKKIKKIGYRKERVLFIEDDPRPAQRNYGNLIVVTSFTGSSNDDELMLLTDFLESIIGAEDVRKIEKENWRNLNNLNQEAE